EAGGPRRAGSRDRNLRDRRPSRLRRVERRLNRRGNGPEDGGRLLDQNQGRGNAEAYGGRGEVDRQGDEALGHDHDSGGGTREQQARGDDSGAARERQGGGRQAGGSAGGRPRFGRGG